MKLLSKGWTNAKTRKNIIETYIMYMAPADTVEGINVCPSASEGCRAACLYTAGMGRFSNVKKSRTNKTILWRDSRKTFYLKLASEILDIIPDSKVDHKIAIRLNGTSDIDHISLLKRYVGINVLDDTFKNIIFYDYTKNISMIKKYLGTNYHLTFSRSESNDDMVLEVLRSGGNVAVVFENGIPESYMGYKVIDGDLSDLRFLDEHNVVVGLKSKGYAKKDVTGFVIDTTQLKKSIAI